MRAFDRLDEGTKRAIAHRLTVRMVRYHAQKIRAPIFESVDFAQRILVIGDRPGPGRPDTVGYHHTPFYSVMHSSLFINLHLHAEGIAEEDLHWVNAFDEHNQQSAQDILGRPWKKIIALGGSAAKWALQSGKPVIQVWHPAAWKRFKHTTPYDLAAAIRNPIVECSETIKLYNQDTALESTT